MVYPCVFGYIVRQFDRLDCMACESEISGEIKFQWAEDIDKVSLKRYNKTRISLKRYNVREELI